ncbi:MAG: metallophosphoesterase [Acidimicrobiales bacterium]
MARVALFGDLSGHTVPLYPALEALGVDLAADRIPEDLVVVQVGALVHKGPDGDEAVALVDRMMLANPGRWVQLIGNHEAQHLAGPGFGTCDCDPSSVDTLRRWTRSGAMHMAVAVEDAEHGTLLVTHAGLSWPWWRRLGRPATPRAAAAELNARFADAERRLALFEPGWMLAWENGVAGVVWAEASRELYGSWLGHRPPFGQVHGHTSAYRWDSSQWWASMPEWVRDAATIDPDTRQSVVPLSGRPFFGIDPGFGEKAPHRQIAPLMLDGTIYLGC